MGFAQGEEKMCNNAIGTFTDPRDGKVYRTVTIKKQIWLAENLDYAGNGGVYYDKASSPPFAKAGRLYTWQQAIAAAPPGWHLPSDDEWNVLVKNTGGKFAAGNRLKATGGWNNYIGKNGRPKNGNGRDVYNFSALPGGYYSSKSKLFRYVGDDGRWWSSSQGGINACKVSHDKPSAKILSTVNGWLCSIRCVKD